MARCIGRLANPTNDARDIADDPAAGLGFQVALKLDVDRDQMRLAVIEFGRALRDGGVGLFYYSGHAAQLDGVNYMIPLGAEVESEDVRSGRDRRCERRARAHGRRRQPPQYCDPRCLPQQPVQGPLPQRNPRPGADARPDRDIHRLCSGARPASPSTAPAPATAPIPAALLEAIRPAGPASRGHLQAGAGAPCWRAPAASARPPGPAPRSPATSSSTCPSHSPRRRRP